MALEYAKKNINVNCISPGFIKTAMTDKIEDKFKEGLNEKEIKVFLTKRYGEYILFKPYFNIKNLLLWLFPFILLILSLGFFIKGLKKY